MVVSPGSYQPLPENEADRVAVLNSLHVLDTPPESDYDDLTQLAAEICETPIALISLVDEHRQWFKSRIGIGPRETGRELSFCAHAICEPERELFIVSDATQDQRFSSNSLVTGAPNIRFYAGTPLITHDGFALGTLCVIDRRARALTPYQERALTTLRRHVVNAMELRRLVGQQNRTIDELEATRRQLTLARCEAEAAARAKSLFLASMSHEIRTPMNAVIGMTAILAGTPLDPEQKDCVTTIRTSGELLLTVINDILDFSKIESGKLSVEHAPFVVAACVANAVDLLDTPAHAKGLSLRTIIDPSVPVAVAGDITRVRQILVNLLSNAVKFTERGEIIVRVERGPSPPDEVELIFSVQDTGIGIPADRLDRLFQQFSQVDISTTRRYGGTGLGLAISKRLAELHGGHMWVQSEPGAGSRFFFSIRAQPASAPEAPAPSADLGAFDPTFAQRHPVEILVAEDNPVNQKVARRLLEKLGYTPEIVANGLEALVALRRRPFDVVLMDVEMPEMDGATATRALRAELPSASQPAVIAVSAHALDSDRTQSMECGLDHYITKPVRLDQLTSALAAAAGWRDARRTASVR